MSLPPPLLPQNPYAAPATADPVAAPAGRRTIDEFVRSGGRYYTAPYNFSVVVMSFRRTMGGVKMVETGKWPMGDVIAATAISAFGGWWGFPWGVIFTPVSLFHLWNGGRDVTDKVLAQYYTPNDARILLASSPKPAKPGLIWLVRGIILLPVILIFTLFMSILNPGRSTDESTATPAPVFRPHHAKPPALRPPDSP